MAFISESQRKAVMAKLHKRGFAVKPKKITMEGRNIRVRVEHPKKFQKKSFRTIDPGKPGGPKLIIGRPLGKKTTKTQAILIHRR